MASGNRGRFLSMAERKRIIFIVNPVSGTSGKNFVLKLIEDYLKAENPDEEVIVDGWSNAEMENFIRVAGTYEEKLVYLSPDPGDFAKGERVRIIGGPFAGAEGIFIRVKGDRRVLINIPGVVAVATTFVHPSMIEKITDPEPHALDNAL